MPGVGSHVSAGQRSTYQIPALRRWHTSHAGANAAHARPGCDGTAKEQHPASSWGLAQQQQPQQRPRLSTTCRVSQTSYDYDSLSSAEFGSPRRRFVWPKLSSPWHLRPQYQASPQALHDEILIRSQATVQIGALYSLVRLASTHEDAQLCFSALEAVRLSLVQREQLKPFSPEFHLRLSQMIVRCDALDLLMATMPRSVELGICLSLNSLHYIMAEYGNALRVDQLLLLMQCLERAGIAPSAQTYYIVMRACFNARRYEEALQYYNNCRAAGLRARPSVVKLMHQAGLPVEMPAEETAESSGSGSNGSVPAEAGEAGEGGAASSSSGSSDGSSSGVAVGEQLVAAASSMAAVAEAEDADGAAESYQHQHEQQEQQQHEEQHQQQEGQQQSQAALGNGNGLPISREGSSESTDAAADAQQQ